MGQSVAIEEERDNPSVSSKVVLSTMFKCVMSQSVFFFFFKRCKIRFSFGFPHFPPLIFTHLFIPLAGSLTSLLFFFFFFHFLLTQHKHFSHTSSFSPTVSTPNQHLHHHFFGKITGKLL